ncbi:MAG: DUF2959 domain-containing protein [Gammaproteobacteria bacterium]|nr:DUF2959 domain-containing protein [Gammaproteobacteria bacterium]
MSRNQRATVFLCIILVGGTTACQKAYYNTMEAMGFDKREILVDRVEETRDAQTSAKEQFASALEQFRSMVNVEGGDLERVYDRLNREYARSETRAEVVRERIASVEAVAEALFKEWQAELDQYSKPSLRRDSERLLKDTRDRYRGLIAAMRRAERAMTPVLAALQDQVLVLKHNLNARAIGALRNELATIERDTAALIAEMERAIAEADAFIKAMG